MSYHSSCLQAGDLWVVLITSFAEVPGLFLSLAITHYMGRKQAFSIPLVGVSITMIPMMTGGWVGVGVGVDGCVGW